MIFKKRVVLLIAVTIAVCLSGLFVSCGGEKDTQEPANNQGDIVPGLTERMNAQDNNTQNADENTAEKEMKTDSGTYTGRVDDRSIEIRISGVQDESKAFRVFALSDEIRENFESYGLESDDQVKFEYYEQEQGQPVLTKIEKISG